MTYGATGPVLFRWEKFRSFKIDRNTQQFMLKFSRFGVVRLHTNKKREARAQQSKPSIARNTPQILQELSFQHANGIIGLPARPNHVIKRRQQPMNRIRVQ